MLGRSIYRHQHSTMVFYKPWRMLEAALVIILFLLDFGVAELPGYYTFLHEATQTPKVSFYDYIIIGGGTAGIPLAATLSKNYSVLLLERGGSPYGNPNVTYVHNYGSYIDDKSPNSPSQQFIVEGVENARPRILGGGTSINAGYYTRGETKFNKEAKLMDDDLIEDSYQWVEEVMVFEPNVWEWQSAFRAGLLEVGITPDNGFTYDHVLGTKVGGTIFDPLGVRHTSADLLQYANPESLSVFVHAIAHKILFKTKGTSKPTAYGIEFEDSLGEMHRAFLKGGDHDEIILSAGALGSPQLLMLSGIGPKEQLDALKIDCVLEQPFVGKDMADNPLNALFIPSPVVVERSLIHVVGITPFGSYIQSTGGSNFIMANKSSYLGFIPEVGGFMLEKIDGPKSKGELKIENLNPADNPSVSFNYFTEREDLEKCVKGLKTILEVVNSGAFSNYKLANMTNQDILDLNIQLPHNFKLRGKKSTSLEQHCKDTVRTQWHYHGGCCIGQVVDDEYKVLGVNSLRVIDGSTFLNSPGTHPQASVLMLGRYMGVTILNQRLVVEKPYTDL